MRPTISASIVCRNEERGIEPCLRSVAWCDEVVVVDSGSTDRTVEIAERHASRVLFHPWAGYAAQKNFALEQTTGAWIFCLDADERCTPELRRAVEERLPAADEVAAFAVRRRSQYLGRWIEHGGWYPDWKVRIARRGRARWGGTDPHDCLIADGSVARLDAEIHHFPYGNFADQIRTVDHYSDVAVAALVARGRTPSVFRAALHPPIKFLECYLWKRGFLDGFPGLVIAVTSAFSVFARHVKLWERTRSRALGE